ADEGEKGADHGQVDLHFADEGDTLADPGEDDDQPEGNADIVDESHDGGHAVADAGKPEPDVGNDNDQGEDDGDRGLVPGFLSDARIDLAATEGLRVFDGHLEGSIPLLLKDMGLGDILAGAGEPRIPNDDLE